MIAAVYARKSTDQSAVADEAKSVTRQIDNARAYALARGWTVDDRYVFVDDGISGAEFSNRPGFLRLMNSLKPRPPFQVLVMSEESRLGRESIETAYSLKQLVQAGVRVFFYLENRERTLGSPTDKIMLSLTAFADELEREKGRQRTADAMDRRARHGHVTGGRVFGYDNVRLADHVERRVNKKEAPVVLRIYQMYAEGHGYRHIAHSLNAQGLPSPRAQQGRPNGWDQGSVRAVLDRPLYRGLLVYKKTRKRDEWGRKKGSARPESDWITVQASTLRIVPKPLTDEVDSRRSDRRTRYLRGTKGQLLGRPVLGKYLLSGLLRCRCGSNFEAQKLPHGLRHEPAYVCSAHRRKGDSVCSNRLALPMAETEERILSVIEGEVLSPAFVERVLDSVFVANDIEKPTLEAELKRLTAEVANFTEAIKLGGDIPTLVTALKTANSERASVLRRLEPAEHADRESLRAALTQRCEEWRKVLRANPTQGRQVLGHLIGPISLWIGDASDLDVADAAVPGDRRGTENISAADMRQPGFVRWRAHTLTSGILAGFGVVQGMASPPGIEPGSRP